MAYRKIEVLGQTFEFYIGKGNTKIRYPGGKGVVVSHSTMTGRSPEVMDRGQEKGTSDGMVTPAHIRAYLEQNPSVS